MAPELRKRKSIPEAQKSNGVAKAAEKPAPKAKGKRKAAEDASPASVKKQKPAKKTAASIKAAEKPVKITEKPAKVTEKPAKVTEKSAKVTKKSAKVTEKPAKAEKKEKVVQNEEDSEKDEQDEGVLQIDGDSDGSDDETNENVEKLAAEVDSEDEAPVDEALSFKPGQSVGKAPIVSKDLVKLAKAPTGEPGVVYIGRIPHGFYEHQMRQYLSQFGPVTRVRLSRNKKTGASKHFAFVEFEESSTAEIVAKTMDNYLLFGHILKCKTIPKEQVHEDLFKGANTRFKVIPRNKMAGLKLQKPQSESAWMAKISKEKIKRAQQAAKLQEMGYEFEAPDLKALPTPQPASAHADVSEGAVEEPAKAIEAAPPVEKEEVPEAEATVSKSKNNQSEAKPESVPSLKKKNMGKAAKGKGKKGKA